jgi:colicin import membrane protein
MGQIIEYSQTEAALATLREKYNRTYDVQTSEGMNLARTARAEIKKYRTSLESKRQELKAPLLERSRLIDAEAKRIEAELAALETPIDEQIKTEERRREEAKAEAERKKQERVDRAWKLTAELRASVGAMVGQPSAEIAAQIAKTRDVVLVGGDDLIPAQVQARDEVIAQLEKLHAATLAQESEAKRIEAERAEVARLRAESEKHAAAERERVRKEREAAAANLAAEEAKAKAERERLDKEAAFARAKEDARIAAERAKLEAEQRAADAKRQKEQAAAEAKAAAEREAAEAKARAEREAKEAAARAAEAERVRKLDARALLSEFVRLYGLIGEFAAVVKAIKDLPPQQEQQATPKKSAAK